MWKRLLVAYPRVNVVDAFPYDTTVQLLPLIEVVVETLLKSSATNLQRGSKQTVVGGPRLMADHQETELLMWIKVTVYPVDLVCEGLAEGFSLKSRFCCAT